MSYTNCIDVSIYQGNIDFQKVKASGISYVIIRSITKNLTIDKNFETNYKNALAAGLKIGVYVYAYATTTSYAKKEAQAVISLLKNRTLHLPIFYDLEGAELGAVNKNTKTSIMNTFASIINQAGYTPGIYCNENWYKTKLDTSALSTYPYWVAKYGTNDGAPHTKPDVTNTLVGWQFTSTGKVSGISGNVDMSIWYGTASLYPTTVSIDITQSSSAVTVSKTVRWTGTVTATSLNVRTWAGTENITVSFSPLKKGTEVDVCDTIKANDGTEWYYIKYNGKYGFASAKYIKQQTTSVVTSTAPSKVSQYTGYVTAALLNIRTWVGVENPVVSFSPLSKGTAVSVCDTVKAASGDDWFYISYNGKYGFCNANYISTTKPTV